MVCGGRSRPSRRFCAGLRAPSDCTRSRRGKQTIPRRTCADASRWHASGWTPATPSSSCTRRLSRIRGFALAPAQFLRLAALELFALWLIVGTGAAVRLTDSGLGCRHWPGCEKGHPLPAKDVHAYIEFGNRLVGGVTIALTLVGWLAARRTRGLPHWVVRLSLAVFVGALAQAPLGYLAVKSDLRWPVVMAHLLLSMLLLAGAVVLVLEARAADEGHVEPLVPRELQRLGYVFVTACLALVVSGTFATAAGPHSGGGEHVDRFASLRPTVY